MVQESGRRLNCLLRESNSDYVRQKWQVSPQRKTVNRYRKQKDRFRSEYSQKKLTGLNVVENRSSNRLGMFSSQTEILR